MKRILCVGDTWMGSNARALFYALRHVGCVIDIIDERYHIPMEDKHIVLKVVERAQRWLRIRELNQEIIKRRDAYRPDIILVYKGRFVMPETIEELKKRARVVQFFPDVSFFAHGTNIPRTLKHYDIIFSTKSFSTSDLNERIGLTNVRYIPHGFDPEVHKKYTSSEVADELTSDVSFIGSWSPHKESLLLEAKRGVGDGTLKIWGAQWEKSTSKRLQENIMGYALYGDYYAMGVCGAKINLGLMSEKRKGASSGDLISSRTFNIPACGGFILHEDNDEVRSYYEENKEIACFTDSRDLIEKINQFLEDDRLREEIAERGYRKSQENYSLRGTAKQILEAIEQL